MYVMISVDSVVVLLLLISSMQWDNVMLYYDFNLIESSIIVTPSSYSSPRQLQVAGYIGSDQATTSLCTEYSTVLLNFDI